MFRCCIVLLYLTPAVTLFYSTFLAVWGLVGVILNRWEEDQNKALTII